MYRKLFWFKGSKYLKVLNDWWRKTIEIGKILNFFQKDKKQNRTCSNDNDFPKLDNWHPQEKNLVDNLLLSQTFWTPRNHTAKKN